MRRLSLLGQMLNLVGYIGEKGYRLQIKVHSLSAIIRKKDQLITTVCKILEVMFYP